MILINNRRLCNYVVDVLDRTVTPAPNTETKLLIHFELGRQKIGHSRDMLKVIVLYI